MKVFAFFLLALIATSAACRFATVGEAFKASFLKVKSIVPKRNKALGSVLPIRLVTLSSTNENLVESLLKNKISKDLAIKIVSTVEGNLKDTYLRSTGIISLESNKENIEKVVCVYRTSKDIGNDYVCIVGTVPTWIAKNEKLRIAGQYLVSLMKRYASMLPAKLRNLHAFTTKGFKMLRGLGGAESQAKLNEFLDGSTKNKEDAYAVLRQSQDDPFVVKLYKNGLTHFSSSASIESLEGVEECMFSEYFDHLAQKMAIPAEKKSNFIDEMVLAVMGSRGEWKSIDFLFKNARATAKYVNCMAAFDSNTSEADFLIADIKASFELGPDVFVTTSTSSSFFGLFSRTVTKIEIGRASCRERV